MAVNFSGSLVATGSIISTTGFTGSLSGTASNAATASSADNFLVRGTLTAQTINVQTITSSIEFNTGSTRNGSLLTNTHEFTGSVGITGSLGINGVDYNSTSASFDTRITNTSSSLATLSNNYTTASASFDIRANANSASISQLSGSYLTDSASFSTRITTNSTNIAAVSSSNQNVSSSLLQFSSSYLADSASFNTRINVISSSYATTGSNKFVGSQTITGSFLVSGSTTQIGNNTLTGNTSLTGSVNISGSTAQVGNNTLLGNTLLSGSITISGSYPVGSTSSSVNIYGDTSMTGYLKFNPQSTNINTNISASYIFVSGSTNDLYFTQNEGGFANTTRLRWLEGNLYTGLLSGGIISATTGSTTFNVSSGSGIIVTINAAVNREPYPTVQYVSWGNFTNQSITYLTSSIQTFIGIDNGGNIVQQTNAFSDGQYNTVITIGTVLHQNKSTVNASITYPNVAYGYKQRTYDFLKAFGPLKLSGLFINTSGSLGLTVGSGTAFADGRNYQIDPDNPSYITDAGTSVSKIFRYYKSGSAFVQDTNNGAGYTVMDPANYNNNGTLTGVSPSTPWTIQRVFWYPNSATKGIVVYYGNQQYDSITEAIANVPYEPFEEVENTKQNAVYLGAIIIKYNGVFTTPGDYSILTAGLFRGVGGSGGGGGSITSRLVDLSDVAVSGPTDHQPLAYDTTAEKWTNQSSISASLKGNADTATSASYAATASFVKTAQTASFVLNAVSSSFANTSSYAITASYVLGQSPTASHALTASSADNFLVRGTLTAQTINAQTVSSSIVYSSGSNIFGDATNDNHQFTGSVLISGSLITNTPITGSSITGSFTGSLSGIASQASTLLVTTSSVNQDYSLAFAPSGADGYVQFYTDGGKDVLYNPSTNILQARNIVALNSISGSLTGSLTGTASYATQAITASFVTLAQSASFTQTAQTASFVQTAQTASYALNTVSASFASTASSVNRLNQSVVISGSLTVSGSTNIVGTAGNTLLSSNADTLIFTGSLLTSGSIVSTGSLNILGGVTGSLLGTSSYAVQALSASYWSGSVTNAASASYVVTAQTASYVITAQTASYWSGSITNAATASYVLNAVSSSFATNATGAFVQGGNSFGAAAIIGTNDTQNLSLETNNSTRLFISSSGNYIGAYRTSRFGNHEPTTQVLEVDGIVRALYQSGASGSFETYGNSNTPVLFTARSDNSQPGILTFNGWGDYAFNKSLLIGYDPQASGYGTGNLYVSSKIGIAKSSSNATLDVNGNAIITGSVTSTLGFTGSLQGTASVATSASYAATASYISGSVAGFPFSGSAIITGSLLVSQSFVDFTKATYVTGSFTGSLQGSSSFATSASYALFAGNAPGTTVGFTQSVAATTWSFTHNLNTRNPLLQVYDSTNSQVIPFNIVGTDPNQATIYFDTAESGFAVASNGGGLTVSGSTARLDQTSAAVTWSFAHNLGTRYPNFIIYNSADEVVIPAGIKAINNFNAEIYFSVPSTGTAIANFSGINGAPNAATASYAETASYSTNFIVANTLTIDQTLTDYHTVASSAAGENNMFNRATGSYSAGFFKYTVTNGANARTGEVMAVWNGGSIQFTDNSTLDIGDTSGVTAAAVIAASSVQFNLTTATSGWRLKSLATFM